MVIALILVSLIFLVLIWVLFAWCATLNREVRELGQLLDFTGNKINSLPSKPIT
jgi:hypothetical protein